MQPDGAAKEAVCLDCIACCDGRQDGMRPFLADGTALALVGTAEKVLAVPNCSAPVPRQAPGGRMHQRTHDGCVSVEKLSTHRESTAGDPPNSLY